MILNKDINKKKVMASKKAFNRYDEFPLDMSSVWNSKYDALVYASNGNPTDEMPSGYPEWDATNYGTPYNGQIITVFENNQANTYVLKEIEGTRDLYDGYPVFDLVPQNPSWQEF